MTGTPQRIVSLVPGGTEILFALGAGPQVVGVSHECDHPAEVTLLPRLTRTSLTADATPAEIDRSVRQAVAATTPLATLDEDLLRRLRPDLIITQDLCPVCAVDEKQLAEAAGGPCPAVVSLHGSTLEGVFQDIQHTADALRRPHAGVELIDSLRQRLQAVAESVASLEGLRVVALEWLDPLFLGGHWVPEMLRWAGAEDALVSTGQPSRQSDWDEITAADPDALVIMPCGFDESAARRQVADLEPIPAWRDLRAVQQGKVYPVDANGLFSRPGPRLVDGVEHLVARLH